MKANIREIRKFRRYSEEFKKELVSLFENGKFSVLQLEKLYGVSSRSIYRWVYQYSRFNKQGYRIVENKQSSSLKLKELEEQVKELERLLGRKQIQIDYLEKMIDIAKEDMGVDIKKNYSTPLSSGSGKTGNK